MIRGALCALIVLICLVAFPAKPHLTGDNDNIVIASDEITEARPMHNLESVFVLDLAEGVENLLMQSEQRFGMHCDRYIILDDRFSAWRQRAENLPIRILRGWRKIQSVVGPGFDSTPQKHTTVVSWGLPRVFNLKGEPPNLAIKADKLGFLGENIGAQLALRHVLSCGDGILGGICTSISLRNSGKCSIGTALRFLPSALRIQDREEQTNQTGQAQGRLQASGTSGLLLRYKVEAFAILASAFAYFAGWGIFEIDTAHDRNRKRLGLMCLLLGICGGAVCMWLGLSGPYG